MYLSIQTLDLPCHSCLPCLTVGLSRISISRTSRLSPPETRHSKGLPLDPLVWKLHETATLSEKLSLSTPILRPLQVWIDRLLHWTWGHEAMATNEPTKRNETKRHPRAWGQEASWVVPQSYICHMAIDWFCAHKVDRQYDGCTKIWTKCDSELCRCVDFFYILTPVHWNSSLGKNEKSCIFLNKNSASEHCTGGETYNRLSWCTHLPSRTWVPSVVTDSRKNMGKTWNTGVGYWQSRWAPTRPDKTMFSRERFPEMFKFIHSAIPIESGNHFTKFASSAPGHGAQLVRQTIKAGLAQGLPVRVQPLWKVGDVVGWLTGLPLTSLTLWLYVYCLHTLLINYISLHSSLHS